MRNSFVHKVVNLGIATALAMAILSACSTTSNLAEGEVLYTGMKHTKYENYENNAHFLDTKAEIEAAIACPPNGAFFNSPYYRTIPYTLWVYNAFSGKEGAVPKWIAKTIGKEPVLMDDANPELRVSVAENVLQNNGFFLGDVSYKVTDEKIGTTKTDTVPRIVSSKIEYKVDFGPLYRLDSIEYKGFSDHEMSLIRKTESVLHRNDPFTVSKLDEERNRIYDTFKDNGYYFFEKSYITYLADTLQVPQHVQLQICKADSLPEDALKPWKIGNMTFRVRRQMMEQLTDTLTRRSLVVEYAGKKPPVRPRVVLRDLRLRPRKMFSQADLSESLSRLTTKGIFSSTDITFTKSPKMADTDSVGTMNMLVDCTLDKPYDFSLSANYTQKSSGRGGPGLGAGFTKRNAFRGGEMLSFNLNGSVEFQMTKGQTNELNYDLGADVTLEMPRLLLPNWLRKHRRWYVPPSTMFTVAINTINRSGYFRRNVLSGEFAYIFKPTQQSTHSFTPLSVAYSHLASSTNAYLDKVGNTLAGRVSLSDYFTPKMRYTYNYSTSSYHTNPITLSVTLEEAGNIACGLKSLFGGKTHYTEQMIVGADTLEYENDAYQMFNTDISQFVRAEFDFVKTWRTGTYSKLLAHVFAGYIHPYGNSSTPPFAELYSAGGANDLRGFPSRGVGPGNFYVDDSDMRYYFSNGNLKLIFNLEYRPRIFGSLYGALFLDAGNVWGTYWKEVESIFNDNNVNLSMAPRLKNMAKEIAVNAGIGIRYDLDFFVVRLDWGFILHSPYISSGAGYFNTPSFGRCQSINFAIGYPF